jgi:hypothetical protein
MDDEACYTTDCHDSYIAIAIPPKGYVVPGERVVAEIIMATFERSIDPTVIAQKGHIKKIKDGVANLEIQNSQIGWHSAFGTAAVPVMDITIKPSTWSFQYFVAAPGISLQLDKTNICYTGIQNPITISVPGYTDDKLKLKVDGATVNKTSDGHFNIFFNKIPKERTYAFVDATNKEGTTSTVASLQIKVGNLPAPIAMIPGAEDGYIRLRDFRKANGLSAHLQDSDFDMSYTIVSYKLSLLHDHNTVYIEPVKGKGSFYNNPSVLRILDMAKRGDKAIFEDIKARDENGGLVELAPTILTLY